MADTNSTFQVECPDCGEVFQITKTAEQLEDPDDLTECPSCAGEFESDFYEDENALELIAPDEDPEDDFASDEDTGEDDE